MVLAMISQVSNNAKILGSVDKKLYFINLMCNKEVSLLAKRRVRGEEKSLCTPAELE